MGKPVIKEIYLFRSISCLVVVLIHAISNYLWVFANNDISTTKGLELIQTLLMFATPMFVFISEFVLAYNYKKVLPNGFFKKRIKFIFIPFLTMGIFYAITSSYQNGVSGILVQSLKNIFLGDYHGYFILIIFQFYLLHYFFHRIEKRYSPVKVISISLLINLVYLSFFNFVPAPNMPYANLIWDRLSWIPLFGWLSYFVIGYYAGVYYDDFKKIVIKTKNYSVISLILTAIISVSFTYLGILPEITSKRVDILLYTLILIIVMFYFMFKISNVPNILMIVNNYSFGIYLLHPFSQAIVTKVFLMLGISNLFILIPVYLLVGVILSILITYFANKIKIGTFFVGKVNIKHSFLTAKSPIANSQSRSE